jgi:hypothetical protein
MAPPTIAVLSHPTSVSIPSDATYHLSKNLTITSSTAGIVSTVPLQVKSIFTAHGITVHDFYTNAKSLSIDHLGNLNTLGAVAVGGSMTSNSLFVTDSSNAQNFSVSDAGVMTLASNATINGNCHVKGTMTIDQATTIKGETDITGTTRINTDKIILENAGAITAKGDLKIGDYFIVDASTGAMTVTGAVTASNTMAVTNNLTVGSNFTVTALSGHIEANSISTTEVTANDHLTVKDITTFHVDNAGVTTIKGDVNVNGTKVNIVANDGYVKTAFTAYAVPDSVTDITTTSLNTTQPSTTCTTSQYLSTQQYVDDQVWAVKKRVHDILGTDEATIASFNHVYELVTKIEGTTAAITLDGLVDQYSEVKVSVSDVIARAYNVVPVNCSGLVFADACPPLPAPATASIIGGGLKDGWYFKNYAAGNKVNWYMPSNGSEMKLRDIKNLYMNIFAVSDVSLPIISVYTKSTGTNDLLSGSIHARIDYLFAPSTTSVVSRKAYCLYTNESPVNIYNETPFKVSNIRTVTHAADTLGQSINTTVTGVSMDELVQYFMINTDSNAAVNNVDFVLSGFNVELVSGTTKHVYSSSSAMTNYMTYKLLGLHQDLSSPSATATAYLDIFDGVIRENQQ